MTRVFKDFVGPLPRRTLMKARARNLLSSRADADLAHDIRQITDVVTFAWLVAEVLLIAHRALRASPPARRAFAAVWLTAAAFFGLFITIVGAGLGWLPSAEAYGTWLEVAVATIPVVLAGTLVLSRLAQDRLVRLMVDLDGRDPSTDLRLDRGRQRRT